MWKNAVRRAATPFLAPAFSTPAQNPSWHSLAGAWVAHAALACGPVDPPSGRLSKPMILATPAAALLLGASCHVHCSPFPVLAGRQHTLVSCNPRRAPCAVHGGIVNLCRGCMRVRWLRVACFVAACDRVRLWCVIMAADSYGTFSEDDIAGLRSEASQRGITRSNPRFIEEHEKPFHLPWFTKIMIVIAVLGFITVGTLLLTAFFSGHLGMMSVTRGGTVPAPTHSPPRAHPTHGHARPRRELADRRFELLRCSPPSRMRPEAPSLLLVENYQERCKAHSLFGHY